MMKPATVAGFIFIVVGETGFEPATPWSQTRCATGLRYSPGILWLVLICIRQMQIFSRAVRARFELAVHFKAYDSLANYWIRPLSHLTCLYCEPRSLFSFLRDCKGNDKVLNCKLINTLLPYFFIFIFN